MRKIFSSQLNKFSKTFVSDSSWDEEKLVLECDAC